jgi:hypothetical protein
VGAIEFLGPVGLAAAGVRTWRNPVALVLAAGGVAVLTDVRLVSAPAGFAFAFLNCALFVLYVVLGHRLARAAAAASFYRELRQRLPATGLRAFAYFSAFDAPWRAWDENPIAGATAHAEEAYFGLYDNDRHPKPVASELPRL